MRAAFPRGWCLVFLLCALAASPAAPQPAESPAPYLADPVASGYVEVAGVKLYHEIHGAGEPLLLLHGGLGGSDHFLAVIPALTRHYRVIIYDRRGHGRSHDTPEPFTYAGMAREANAFMDAIGVDSAAVVGFSDGGVIGYHLASTYPGRVTKLVALGANYRVEGMGAETVAWISNRLNESGIAEDYPAIKESYEKARPGGGNFASFLVRSRDLWLREPYLPAEDLRKIQIPVLLMAGDHEDIATEHLLEIRALVAGSQFCVIPNSDHFVMGTKPELFTTLVLDFLAGR